MDLFTLIKVVLSRWQLVLAILLASCALAYVVETQTRSEYEATGYLVFESPNLDVTHDAGALVDLVQMSQGIQLDDRDDGRSFNVTSLGGDNYRVSATTLEADQAVSDVRAVIEQLSQQIATIQEQEAVAEAEYLDLRLISPQVSAEALPDGTFAASAQVFLYDPSAVFPNPYRADASTGRLLQVAVSSDAADEEFVERAGSGVEFVVGQEARDAAPLVSVVTMGSDAEQVMEAFYIVRDMLVEELRAREQRAGVLPSQRLSLEVIDAPMGVVDNSPPVTRAALLVIALGCLLALGVAIGMDSIRRRREGWAVGRAAAPGPSATTPQPQVGENMSTSSPDIPDVDPSGPGSHEPEPVRTGFVSPSVQHDGAAPPENHERAPNPATRSLEERLRRQVALQTGHDRRGGAATSASPTADGSGHAASTPRSSRALRDEVGAADERHTPR